MERKKTINERSRKKEILKKEIMETMEPQEGKSTTLLTFYSTGFTLPGCFSKNQIKHYCNQTWQREMPSVPLSPISLGRKETACKNSIEKQKSGRAKVERKKQKHVHTQPPLKRESRTTQSTYKNAGLDDGNRF